LRLATDEKILLTKCAGGHASARLRPGPEHHPRRSWAGILVLRGGTGSVV
jgi:hypothetical protein